MVRGAGGRGRGRAHLALDMRRLLGGLIRAPLLCRLAVDGRAALAVDEHVEAHAASGLDEGLPLGPPEKT